MEASRSGRATGRRMRIRSPNGACLTWPNSTISTPRIELLTHASAPRNAADGDRFAEARNPITPRADRLL